MSALHQSRETLGSGAAAVRRISLDALLVRVLVWALGVGSIAVMLPSQMYDGTYHQAYGLSPVLVAVVVGVLSLLPAVLPGSKVVLGFQVLVVVGWIIRTTFLGFPPGFLAVAGVLVLALLLYLHHSVSGLAAAMPLDARLVPGVVRRWLMRLAVPALATVVVGVPALLARSRVGPLPTVVVPVAGVVLALVTAALLVYAARTVRR
ncbi:MAG TPA: hypothetical protein VIL34_03030 [Actinopolymorphaceae bacterium]|jgi:hypothetical protein